MWQCQNHFLRPKIDFRRPAYRCRRWRRCSRSGWRVRGLTPALASKFFYHSVMKNHWKHVKMRLIVAFAWINRSACYVPDEMLGRPPRCQSSACPARRARWLPARAILGVATTSFRNKLRRSHGRWPSRTPKKTKVSRPMRTMMPLTISITSNNAKNGTNSNEILQPTVYKISKVF